MNRASEPTPTTPQRPWTWASWAGFLIGPAFFALAAWFLIGPDLLDIPHTPIVVAPAEAITTAPRRQTLSDPPTIVVNGFKRTCMDCHRLFPPREQTPKRLLQHKHIHLNHGINDRCRNCHNVQDRNKLVTYNGEPVSFNNVVRLCAKCHGPTYRDWQRGMHGRTNGYWDPTRGPVRRLRCTECHDPHDPRHPAMDPLTPLPPPHTIRMPEHEPVAKAEPHLHDPLRDALERFTELEQQQPSRQSAPAQASQTPGP